MSGSVNKVILVGRLGADPEIRRTQDGRPIANLRVATEKSWKNKNTGEKMVKLEWHRVVVFAEGLAKIVEQYFKKGTLVYIEGSLQTRKWVDQGGQDRYSTEVILQPYDGIATILSNAPGGRGDQAQDEGGSSDFGSSQSGSSQRQPAAGTGGARQPSRQEDMSDDIPFDFKDLDRFKP